VMNMDSTAAKIGRSIKKREITASPSAVVNGQQPGH